MQEPQSSHCVMSVQAGAGVVTISTANKAAARRTSITIISSVIASSLIVLALPVLALLDTAVLAPTLSAVALPSTFSLEMLQGVLSVAMGAHFMGFRGH